jgi:Putative transposase/Transposase zinc-binding domain
VLGPNKAGRFDIADIVRGHRVTLESEHSLSPQQKRVLTDIAQCRTAKLGGHLDKCVNDCGYERPSYNSCRNRHCPKCQALAQEKWISEQEQRMLDVKHFHVVLTLPAELRPLAMFAKDAVYGALFRAASSTLLEFGERRLSGTIGATLVLHTWTRDLQFHPHVHAIVTGGALSSDGKRWCSSHRDYLFPVFLMSEVFAAKMIDELKRAYKDEEFARFSDFDDPEAFSRLVNRLWKLPWVVYAKPTFRKGKYVLEYLGRYTHRVGIANSRLLDVTNEYVLFRTKNGSTETLPPVEFLRRFVQHVLPDGFHKIRHYGLNAAPEKRDLARAILKIQVVAVKPLSWRERLAKIEGHDTSRCPNCSGLLVSLPLAHARAPPEMAA